MRFRHIKLLLLAAALLPLQVNAAEETNRSLLKTIAQKDLTTLCPSRYLEIHLSASNAEEAGLAILKLFWLVDSEFVKGLVNGNLTGNEIGMYLGEAFRRYCEQKPVVTVDVAVKQSIIYMRYKNENPN